MESYEEPVSSAAAEMMETEDTLKEDDLLQSVSMEDIGGGGSVSSSILNSDDEEDGVNVTIKEVHNMPPENPRNRESEVVRPKLSGAKKKRFRKLLLSGHNREEPLSMALMPQQVSTPKRTRNMNCSSNSEGNPIPKKQKGLQVHHSVNKRMDNIRSGTTTNEKNANQQPTYSEVAKWVRVGILPKNYPQFQLTTEQMDMVQESILEKVAMQRRESFKPKFINCWQRTGHLLINCQDTETADWLDTVIPTLYPWQGAELTVVQADDIPRLDVMIGFFPQSVNNDNDTIRIFIESQNDGLTTDKWRIIQRNILYEKHVEWYFTVDEASMQHFRTCNFLINYKFGQTTLRKKGMYKPDSNGKVSLSDDTKDQEPEDFVSTGNQQDLSVPGTSGIHGNSLKVHVSESQTLNSNTDDRKPTDQNRSGPPMDQNRSGPCKAQNCFGPPKDQSYSEPQMDKTRSGPPKDQNRSGPSKDQSCFGPPKDQNHSKPQKDQYHSGPPKDRSRSGYEHYV
nr:uncharacterized protein LOC115258514 [Aedes albopictus]